MQLIFTTKSNNNYCLLLLLLLSSPSFSVVQLWRRMYGTGEVPPIQAVGPDFRGTVVAVVLVAVAVWLRRGCGG